MRMTPITDSQQAKVLAADEARYQALYAQDTATLQQMLAADYVHTHANGKTDDKATFLSSVSAGRYRFVEAVRTDQRVRAVGPAIVLSGTTRTTLDVGGETKVMRNAFVTVWVESDAALQLLHWQATALPAA